jgi:pantoate--beta-alanine ligase
MSQRDNIPTPITASEMKVVARISDAREALRAARRGGQRVALVPTMGFLHSGHLTLAAEAVRLADCAVMSIFVNPLQFGPSEDFARYPRDPQRDLAQARDAGIDLMFMPGTAEMYATPSTAIVTPRAAAGRWEGAVRPGHFEGVLTVVAKLFNIVQPDVAVFGQKDIQQATLVRGMIRSLDFPIELVIVPTVREPDGLAMSSRNAYLSAADRARARALSGALRAVDAAWRGGQRDVARLERIGRDMLSAATGVVTDYFAIVAPETLEPAVTADPGAIVIVAAKVGQTRLIDNLILDVGLPPISGGPGPAS